MWRFPSTKLHKLKKRLNVQTIELRKIFIVIYIKLLSTSTNGLYNSIKKIALNSVSIQIALPRISINYSYYRNQKLQNFMHNVLVFMRLRNKIPLKTIQTFS